MKRIFSLLLFTLTSSFLNAGIEVEKSYPDFYISETKEDKALIPQQCQVILNFNFGETIPIGQRVYMSINGLLENIVLSEAPVKFDLTPGKYHFKIWGGPGYQEIITDSIEFRSQTISTAQVTMNPAYEERIMVLKPVIYFRSPKEMNVAVNVIPTGEFIFTYPEIGSGWKGTVKTDGSFEQNGVRYPYLFWESDQKYMFQPADNGYKVERGEVIPFLEKKCNELGFTEKERTDFITFWGPRLTAEEAVYVQFEIGESCNKFAGLSIVPEPDAVQRVYIEFTAWNDAMLSYLKDKTFSSDNSFGFTVLEWGGFSFTAPNQLSQNK